MWRLQHVRLIYSPNSPNNCPYIFWAVCPLKNRLCRSTPFGRAFCSWGRRLRFYSLAQVRQKLCCSLGICIVKGAYIIPSDPFFCAAFPFPSTCGRNRP